MENWVKWPARRHLKSILRIGSLVAILVTFGYFFACLKGSTPWMLDTTPFEGVRIRYYRMFEGLFAWLALALGWLLIWVVAQVGRNQEISVRKRVITGSIFGTIFAVIGVAAEDFLITIAPSALLLVFALGLLTAGTKDPSQALKECILEVASGGWTLGFLGFLPYGVLASALFATVLGVALTIIYLVSFYSTKSAQYILSGEPFIRLGDWLTAKPKE